MLEFLIFAVTVIIFLIFAVIYLYPGSKRSTTIPGPEPVDSLEGNVPDIISSGGLVDFLAQVHQDYGPIVSFTMGPQMFVSIAKASLFEEQASLFDRAGELFSSYLPLIGEDSIQVTNGAEGRRRHAVYSKCFTTTSIESYFSVYNELAHELVKKWTLWTQEEYIPVKEHCLDFAIRAILCAVFGLEPDDQLVKRAQANYVACSAECHQQSMGDYPEAGGARIKRFAQSKESLYEILREAVSHQKEFASGKKDNNVIAAALSLNLPESTVYSDLITIFIGGFHTTASLLTWSIYYLAVHPEIQERARKEVLEVLGNVDQITFDAVDKLKYLNQFINETLRLSASGPFAARVQQVDTVLGGHTIPAGTPVIHNLKVALMDPEIFHEPEKFYPDRFSPENESKLPPLAFEPFGFAGKRKCIGYRFSLAETLTLLATILRSNLHLSLAPDQTVIPKTTIVTFPSDELWLTVEKMKDL